MPSLTITVRNAATFVPIAGATVRINAINRELTGTTNALGQVTFNDVDVLKRGTAFVSASGFKTQLFNNVLDGSTLNLFAGSGYQETITNSVILTSLGFLKYVAVAPDNDFTGFPGAFGDVRVTFTDLIHGDVLGPFTLREYGDSDTSVTITASFKRSYYSWTLEVLNDEHPAPPPEQTCFGWCYIDNFFSVALFLFTAFNAASVPPDPDGDDETGLAFPSIIHTRFGQYLLTCQSDAAVHAGRAPFTIPPFDFIQATGQDGRRPALTIPEGERVLIAFQTSGDSPSVRTIYSDDDADTWGGLETVIDSGQYPRLATNRYGHTLLVAYVETDSEAGTGELRGVRMGPSLRLPGPVFTLTDDTGAALSASNKGFDISPAPDGEERWLLVLSAGGTLTHYASTDDGETWEEVS